MLLVGCASYSYRCTEHMCTAAFEGPGWLDLSDANGPMLEVVAIDGPTVRVRVDGKDTKLVEGIPRTVAGYVLTLTGLDGENVLLLIE
jgi:hypothetical protein